MALKVGIVEDDALLRQEFQDLVSGAPDMQCVRACPSAEDALQTLPIAAPEVVLMDLNLPGMSGIDCTRRLKAAMPAVEIVMLTSVDSTESIFESLTAGASGYVLKRASGAQILDAVRDAAAGGAPMTGAIARKVVQFFGRGKAVAAVPAADPAVAALTDREREVLAALAEGQQYKEIADTLGISINTVRKYIKSVYEKLHVNTRLDAVRKLGRA